MSKYLPDRCCLLQCRFWRTQSAVPFFFPAQKLHTRMDTSFHAALFNNPIMASFSLSLNYCIPTYILFPYIAFFFENFSSLLRILLFKRINYSQRLPARGCFSFSSLQSRQYVCDWSKSLRKVKLYFHQFLLSSLINSSGFCTVLSTMRYSLLLCCTLFLMVFLVLT